MELIKVEKAELKDLDKLWAIIDENNKRKNIIRRYEDFNEMHSKESLKGVLKNSNKDEIIFIALHNKNIIGILDFVYKYSDYLFFIDKYAYIRYFHIDKKFVKTKEEKEYISKILFNSALEKAKLFGYTYICGDVLEGEEDLEELFNLNDMKKYRNRLCKEI